MTTKSETTKKIVKGGNPRGYRNHLRGSRKEAVHICYDAKGKEAAEALGLEAGLKLSTLHGWISAWRRAAEKEPKPNKAIQKKATRKATKEPAAKAA